MKLVLLSVLAAGAAVLGTAAPASADPWPVCVTYGNPPSGGVCADPTHDRCLVYGGGTVWNLCVVNPVPLICPLICTAPE